MSCSFLALSTAAWAVDYRALRAQLKAEPSLTARRQTLRHFQKTGEADAELQEQLDKLVAAWDSGTPWSPDTVIDMIDIRATLETAPKSANDAEAAQQAKAIKQNPLYRDPGIEESSNWFGRAMSRFGEAIGRVLDAMFRNNRQPNVPQPNVGALSTIAVVIKYGFIALIVIALVGFMIYVLRQYQVKARLQRRATAMLEDDEPERTIDEWLVQADLLTSQGKWREAVRCLYLACLLRFDEAGVARFIRSQTNWEHLARISASPLLPAGVDFRPQTHAFDLVWYGFKVQGRPDVDKFRAWYVELTEKLDKVAA